MSRWIKQTTGIFNVHNYGAIGDGSTDDTSPIQAAIDAANAVSGGIVYFPQGTYISTLLTLYSNIHLLGDGIGTTTIKLKNSTNTALIQGYNFASLTGGDTTGGIEDFSIQAMTLDGNIANNGTTGYGLRVYGQRYILRDLDFVDWKTNCVYSEWATASSENMEARVDNCRFHKASQAATPTTGALVYWQGPHDSVFTGNSFFYGTSQGVYGVGAAASAGLQFTNCHAYGNYQTYGFDLEGNGSILTACVSEGAADAQIRLKDNNQQVRDCYIFDAGASAPVGIEIDGAGGYVIQNCMLLNCDNGAVLFTDDSSGLGFITGNLIYGTTGDSFAGTPDVSTKFSNNIPIGMDDSPGASVTIATGVAALPAGAEYAKISGEGATADDLTNITPMRRAGDIITIATNHQITLKDVAGGTGQIITGKGGDIIIPQYGVFQIISDNPNWIVISGSYG